MPNKDAAPIQSAELAELRRLADGVPEGWRLVPTEPTGIMKDAGSFSGLPVSVASPWVAATVYRAMIDAAPTAAPTAQPLTDAARLDWLEQAMASNHPSTPYYDTEPGAFGFPYLVSGDGGFGGGVGFRGFGDSLREAIDAARFIGATPARGEDA